MPEEEMTFARIIRYRTRTRHTSGTSRQVADVLSQQSVLVGVVRVEDRAVHVGPIDRILDAGSLVTQFEHQPPALGLARDSIDASVAVITPAFQAARLTVHEALAHV
jgi:hypothetical protein